MSPPFFQTVATIGSTLTSVSHDVENIQTAIEEYKKSLEILQNDVVRNLYWFNWVYSEFTCLIWKKHKSSVKFLPYVFKALSKSQ